MVLGCKECGRKRGRNHMSTCSCLNGRNLISHYNTWDAWHVFNNECRWWADDPDPTVTYTRADGRTLTLSARTKKELVMNLKTLATIS